VSIIVVACDDPCPIHSGALCCMAQGHELPHRTRLVGTKVGFVQRDHVVVEWRPARDDERWSDPMPGESP
jgi:hypothetical protein